MTTELPRPIGAVSGSKVVTARCNLIGVCDEKPIAMLVSSYEGIGGGAARDQYHDPACRQHLATYGLDRLLGVDELHEGRADRYRIRAFTPAEQSAIDKAWAPEPDITFPLTPNDGPTAIEVTLDGKAYVVVNWRDYRGFEVRRKARYENDERAQSALGWIRNVESTDIIVQIDPSTQIGRRSGFKRLDEALRWLVAQR